MVYVGRLLCSVVSLCLSFSVCFRCVYFVPEALWKCLHCCPGRLRSSASAPTGKAAVAARTAECVLRCVCVCVCWYVGMWLHAFVYNSCLFCGCVGMVR